MAYIDAARCDDLLALCALAERVTEAERERDETHAQFAKYMISEKECCEERVRERVNRTAEDVAEAAKRDIERLEARVAALEKALLCVKDGLNGMHAWVDEVIVEALAPRRDADGAGGKRREA